jgi:cell fate regulator YaaT (PSP1 superfamily)
VNTTEEKVKLIGVVFRKNMKTFYLPKPHFPVKLFDKVIIEVSGNLKIATVRRPLVLLDVKRWDIIRSRDIIGHVIRKATEKDLLYLKKLDLKEKEAFEICRKKIKEHNLPMHLVESEWDDKEKKFIFYFTAESRVDFRELVKDLIKTFNCKIQLWQVGARDAMKFFGGYGPCGLPLCCTNSLRQLESVELSFARMQNLPMNTAKITGACGKLVCCLRYELGNIDNDQKEDENEESN